MAFIAIFVIRLKGFIIEVDAFYMPDVVISIYVYSAVIFCISWNLWEFLSLACCPKSSVWPYDAAALRFCNN